VKKTAPGSMGVCADRKRGKKRQSGTGGDGRDVSGGKEREARELWRRPGVVLSCGLPCDGCGTAAC